MAGEAAWDRNDIQFPRLLAEVWAVGLTAKQLGDICISMNLRREDVEAIFERAEEVFEGIKEHADTPLVSCYVCGRD